MNKYTEENITLQLLHKKLHSEKLVEVGVPSVFSVEELFIIEWEYKITKFKYKTISSLNDKHQNPPINKSQSEDWNAPIIASHSADYTDS